MNRSNKLDNSTEAPANNSTDPWEFPAQTELEMAGAIVPAIVPQTLSLGNGPIFSSVAPRFPGYLKWCLCAVCVFPFPSLPFPSLPFPRQTPHKHHTRCTELTPYETAGPPRPRNCRTHLHRQPPPGANSSAVAGWPMPSVAPPPGPSVPNCPAS